jgi:hypothetical protein
METDKIDKTLPSLSKIKRVQAPVNIWENLQSTLNKQTVKMPNNWMVAAAVAFILLLSSDILVARSSLNQTSEKSIENYISTFNNQLYE